MPHHPIRTAQHTPHHLPLPTLGFVAGASAAAAALGASAAGAFGASAAGAGLGACGAAAGASPAGLAGAAACLGGAGGAATAAAGLAAWMGAGACVPAKAAAAAAAPARAGTVRLITSWGTVSSRRSSALMASCALAWPRLGSTVALLRMAALSTCARRTCRLREGEWSCSAACT